MASRLFPSFRLFRDQRKKWRWTYDLQERLPIAASSEAYDSRAECERMIALLQSSTNAPLWIAKLDLVHA